MKGGSSGASSVATHLNLTATLVTEVRDVLPSPAARGDRGLVQRQVTEEIPSRSARLTLEPKDRGTMSMPQDGTRGFGVVEGVPT